MSATRGSAAAAAASAEAAAAHCLRLSQRRGRVTAVASSPSTQEERQGFAAKVAPTAGDPSEEEAKAVAAATYVPEVLYIVCICVRVPAVCVGKGGGGGLCLSCDV